MPASGRQQSEAPTTSGSAGGTGPGRGRVLPLVIVGSGTPYVALVAQLVVLGVALSGRWPVATS